MDDTQIKSMLHQVVSSVVAKNTFTELFFMYHLMTTASTQLVLLEIYKKTADILSPA